MAIYFDKDSKVSIIDRTIDELLLLNPECNLKKYGCIYLCRLLNSYGVDLFEISVQNAARFKRLPSGLEFIIRIESENDIIFLESLNIKKCIIHEEYASVSILKQLRNAGISIILEITAITEEDIASAMARVKHLLEYIDVLRISEIEKVDSFSWLSKIKSLLNSAKIKIDICPSDRLSMGTAIAFEAAAGKADFLSLAFAGIGGINGFAAFEEVLLAIMVLKEIKNHVSLKTLPDAASHFKKICGLDISPIKPIIGRNIFMYESGLHADGIQKNPVTYELYDPDLVGQKRTLLIGKHSGKASIAFKLKEMGIDCRLDEAEKILKDVRDVSIHMGHHLNEEEIIKLYGVHCNESLRS